MRFQLLGAVLAITLVSPRICRGVDKFWSDWGNWSIPNAWSPVGVPLVGDRAVVQPHSPLILGSTYVLNFDQAGQTELLSGVELRGSFNYRVQLNVVRGELQTEQLAIREAGGNQFFGQIGSISLSGGHLFVRDTLSLGPDVNSGALRISGGTLTAGSILFPSNSSISVRPFEMTGGVVNLNEFVVGRSLPGNLGIGSATITGGTFNVAGTLNVGTLATLRFESPSRLNVGRIVADGALEPFCRVRIEDPSQPSIFNLYGMLGSLGQIDIQQGGLILDHPQRTALGMFNSARADVLRGYAEGNWDGMGITSSSVPGANSSMAVGVVVGYEIYGNSGSGSFMGVPADNGDVLVRYSFAGDVNLDGAVDISDFSRLAANFNRGATWYNGDVNYDVFTDIADFALLASNFGKSLTTSLSRASVPEPTGAAIVAALAAGRFGRIRRG